MNKTTFHTVLAAMLIAVGTNFSVANAGNYALANSNVISSNSTCNSIKDEQDIKHLSERFVSSRKANGKLSVSDDDCLFSLTTGKAQVFVDHVLRLNGLSEQDIQKYKKDADSNTVNLENISEILNQIPKQGKSKGSRVQDASWYGYQQQFTYYSSYYCGSWQNCRSATYMMTSQYLCDSDPDYDYVLAYDRGSVVTNPNGLKLYTNDSGVYAFLVANGMKLNSFGLPNNSSWWYVCAGDQRLSWFTTPNNMQNNLKLFQQ